MLRSFFAMRQARGGALGYNDAVAKSCQIERQHSIFDRMNTMRYAICLSTFACVLACEVNLIANDNWPQLQGNASRSGNAPSVTLETQLDGNERLFEIAARSSCHRLE